MSVGSGSELPTGTVTFVFTDIEGSTGLLKRLDDGYAGVLDNHRRLLREAFAAHGGREIDTQGDSFFYAFARAKHAVQAAIDGQRALAASEWPDGVEVRVRMGLHSGEPLVGDERYVGIGVNRAARIGAAAHGGQVLVSDATRGLVEDDLPQGVFLHDLGYWRLKDIDRPERVSQLAAEGLQVEFPPLRGAERVKAPPVLRRRSVLAAALVGVIAAAVAIPVFALGGGSGTSGSTRVARLDADSVGALDASNGRLLASSLIRSGPGALAADRRSVWVTTPDSDSVTRIDIGSHVKQTIPVGADPSGIAIGGGFVWVANGLEGTVSKIDPNANAGGGGVVDTIPVGNGPAGVAFGNGRVWVANATDRTVSEIVSGSRTPLPAIPVGAGADAIAAGFGFVWVLSESGEGVTRIDARSGVVLPPISVGNAPTAIATGAGAVWVANGGDATVSRIDLRTSAVTVIPVSDGPSGVAAGRRAVWVSDEHDGRLYRIDPAAGKVVQTVVTGNRPAGVAMSGAALYVAVKTSGLGHRGGTLRVLTQSIDSIDPAVTYGYDDWRALILTNDGLVTFRRAGGAAGAVLVPDLATSIPTPTDGGTTYTFQVRTGVHYSTGALVRAVDFRHAIERSLVNGSGTGFYFNGIVGAEGCVKKPARCDLSKGIVVDPATNTVTFHLTAPDPDFLDKLAISSAYAVPANIPVKARLPLPATGPYKIKGFNAKRGLVLVRNPRFRQWSEAAQPNGYPDRIVWTFNLSPDAQVRAVKDGRADYAEYVGNEARLSALRRDGYGSLIRTSPGTSTYYYFLNTQVAPFNNLRARQAVSYAVDRNKSLDIYGGTDLAQPTCQVLPPSFSGYRPYCPYTVDAGPSGHYAGPDLAKAEKLIAASGTRGQAITVWAANWHFGKVRGAYLVSVLNSLGYKARLKLVGRPGLVSLGTYFAEVSDSRNNVQAGVSGWSPDYPSSSNFFYPNFTCQSFIPREKKPYENSNYAEFCNARIDSEINRARALQTSDPQAASTLWHKIDQDVVNQAPWVTTAIPRNVDLISRRVGNYAYNPQWLALFDQMWVR